MDILRSVVRLRDTVNLSLRIELLLFILPRKNTNSIAAFGNLIELLKEVRVVVGASTRVV
jgi:hypothetical protein